MKSMTGYGHARAVGRDFAVDVELQTYNHRFLDCKVKLPPGYVGQESFVVKQLGGRLARGRVNAYVELQLAPSRARVTVNRDLAAKYWKALQRLERELGCSAGFCPDRLLDLPGVLVSDRGAPSSRQFKKVLSESLSEALDRLEAMRSREGKRLAADLRRHLRRLDRGLKAVRRLQGKSGSDANVDEELERLAGHIEQFGRILGGEEPSGKVLEFITREMLREATTLADKSCRLEVSRQAVEMKTAIESLKEQVRNAE